MASESELDVFSTALALPARERARLAHELLASLDTATDPDAAVAWAEEIERRASEVRSGGPVEDWDAVRARLTDRWSKR
jgi:putative addiction module component (TIGR02574 family)